MRDFYEGVWAGMPDDPEPWAWRRRRALLLARGRGRASACSTSAAARGASSPRCATPAPIPSASSSPRPRSSARGATCRAPTSGCVAPDGSLPLGHGEIDLVWCSEVLEHVPDTVAFLTEVRRVLRPRGRLLVTVPDHGRLKRTLLALAHYDAHYDPLGQHVRFYTRRSLTRALHATGFVDVGLRPLGGPPLLRQALVARAVRG